MNAFGGRSPWDGSIFSGRPALGQIPLILGPSSWGAGFSPAPAYHDPGGAPPYWGEWGVVDEGTGEYVDGGRVGPFGSVEEAFRAAGEAAVEHGAKRMPLDGFAQVKDSRGQPVGPII